MTDKIFDIEFDYNGASHIGWATPSTHKRDDGTPTSYHVVLNGVMFGNVSFDSGKWLVDERRPHELVKLVGQAIDEYKNTMKSA